MPNTPARSAESHCTTHAAPDLRPLEDESPQNSTERERSERPRAFVVEALHASMEQFDDLYRELAK